MATVTRKAKPVKFTCSFVSITVEINDARYSVDKIDAGECGTAAYRLTKHAKDDGCYDVLRTHSGVCECSCPDYEARHRGNGFGMCKHARALVELGLLAAPVACCAPAEATPCMACVSDSDTPPAPAVEPTPEPEAPLNIEYPPVDLPSIGESFHPVPEAPDDEPPPASNPCCDPDEDTWCLECCNSDPATWGEWVDADVWCITGEFQPEPEGPAPEPERDPLPAPEADPDAPAPSRPPTTRTRSTTRRSRPAPTSTRPSGSAWSSWSNANGRSSSRGATTAGGCWPGRWPSWRPGSTWSTRRPPPNTPPGSASSTRRSRPSTRPGAMTRRRKRPGNARRPPATSDTTPDPPHQGQGRPVTLLRSDPMPERWTKIGCVPYASAAPTAAGPGSTRVFYSRGGGTEFCCRSASWGSHGTGSHNFRDYGDASGCDEWGRDNGKTYPAAEFEDQS